ncbi:MAG: methyl-accepting chemotaxis protein, partial [Rhodopila sp.]
MRFTIKTKLGMAFGAIIAMSAGAITLGVENLSSLNTSLNKLVDGPAAQRTMALRLVNDVLLLIRS